MLARRMRRRCDEGATKGRGWCHVSRATKGPGAGWGALMLHSGGRVVNESDGELWVGADVTSACGAARRTGGAGKGGRGGRSRARGGAGGGRHLGLGAGGTATWWDAPLRKLSCCRGMFHVKHSAPTSGNAPGVRGTRCGCRDFAGAGACVKLTQSRGVIPTNCRALADACAR